MHALCLNRTHVRNMANVSNLGCVFSKIIETELTISTGVVFVKRQVFLFSDSTVNF